MKFIDNEHKRFYNEKMLQVPYQDSYNRSLIYLMVVLMITQDIIQ